MEKKGMTYYLILLFLLLGTVLIMIRVGCSLITSKPEGKDYWKVTYRIKFRGEATSSPCWIAIPTESPAVRVVRESYSHSQLELVFRQDQESLERDVLLMPHPNAQVHFEAQFDLFLKGESTFPAIPKEDLTPETRLHFLRDQEGIPTRHPFISKTLKTLMAEDEDKSDIIERIYSVSTGSISTSFHASPLYSSSWC